MGNVSNIIIGGAAMVAEWYLGYIVDGVAMMIESDMWYGSVETIPMDIVARRPRTHYKFVTTMVEPTTANLKIAYDWKNTPYGTAPILLGFGGENFIPTERSVEIYGYVPGGNLYTRKLVLDRAVVEPGGEYKHVDSDMVKVQVTFKGMYCPVTSRVGAISDRTTATGLSIAAWGRNNREQVSTVPTDSEYTMLASSWENSLALRVDGSITVWGTNTQKQRTVPLPNSGFIYIAGSRGGTLYGVRSDGTLAVWGYNYPGWDNGKPPTPNAGFVAACGGDYHSIALKSDGTIVCWGDSSDGKLVVPSPNSGFTKIAAGRDHSYALRSDGSIAAWGDNYNGQCSVPAPNSGFVDLGSGGEWHSAAVKSDGSIVCWGSNVAGQCDVPTPNTNFAAVSCGGFFTMGLKTDGSIVTWGNPAYPDNAYGQLVVPLPNERWQAIAGGGYHSAALQQD